MLSLSNAQGNRSRRICWCAYCCSSEARVCKSTAIATAAAAICLVKLARPYTIAFNTCTCCVLVSRESLYVRIVVVKMFTLLAHDVNDYNNTYLGLFGEFYHGMPRDGRWDAAGSVGFPCGIPRLPTTGTYPQGSRMQISFKCPYRELRTHYSTNPARYSTTQRSVPQDHRHVPLPPQKTTCCYQACEGKERGA